MKVRIDLWWRASRRSIEDSVRNAMRVAEQLGLKSLAFPVIGAGSGSFNAESAERIMLETFEALEAPVEIVVVRFRQRGGRGSSP